MVEQWIDVEGFEGLYQVSDQGRVRSLPRLVPMIDGRSYNVTGGILSGGETNGYSSVTLSRAGEEITCRVHVLVARAFIGPRPEGFVICHGDGIRSNNAVANLRYDTPAENSADRAKHGTVALGEKHGKTTLTEADIHAIRDARRKGETLKSIAQRFDVHFSTISNIAVGKTWGHVG